jgi:hypothetical protein
MAVSPDACQSTPLLELASEAWQRDGSAIRRRMHKLFAKGGVDQLPDEGKEESFAACHL